MNHQEKIERTVELIRRNSPHPIQAILLFGSHADNTATWRSDIDICVLLEKEITIEEEFIFKKTLLGLLPENIDLQIFHHLPLKIKKSIADNHKVIFETQKFNDVTFTRVSQELFFELKNRTRAMGV